MNEDELIELRMRVDEGKWKHKTWRDAHGALHVNVTARNLIY